MSSQHRCSGSSACRSAVRLSRWISSPPTDPRNLAPYVHFKQGSGGPDFGGIPITSPGVTTSRAPIVAGTRRLCCARSGENNELLLTGVNPEPASTPHPTSIKDIALTKAYRRQRGMARSTPFDIAKSCRRLERHGSCTVGP